MTDKEKSLLNTVLLELLPYETRVAIDFKSYLEILPDDSPEDPCPYKGNLEFFLKQQR